MAAVQGDQAAQMKKMMAMLQEATAKSMLAAKPKPGLADGKPQPMDRQERRKLIVEIKEEMKTTITAIADDRADRAATAVRTLVRKVEGENNADKKRMENQFKDQLSGLAESFRRVI